MPEPNVTSITNEDIAIVSLKGHITDLNLQITQLTSQISNFSDTARNALRMCNRVSAMRSIRSKKMAEQSLARKLINLSQLEEAYDQIEQAVDQVALIAAMKSTTQVLRGLHSGIDDVEHIKNVIEELQSEIVKSDGIRDAMEEVGQGANAADDEKAIDAELERLAHHANLSDDNKQILDVAAKLKSISALEKINPSIIKQRKNTPGAAVSTHALPNQRVLLEREY